ncbi:MAG: HAMP domain-containing histidine kinase [Bdellovibrionales bacterium]|nr:HAMP domain-containing histidine kinase [Bdellovibrionales bacterium]
MAECRYYFVIQRLIRYIQKYFQFMMLPETSYETESRVKHLKTAIFFFLIYFPIHTYLVVPKLAGSWEATLVHPRFITGNIGILLSFVTLVLNRVGLTRLAGIVGSYQFTIIGVMLFEDKSVLGATPYVSFSIVAVGIMVSNLIAVMLDVIIFATVSTVALVLINQQLGAFPGAEMTSRMIIVYASLTYTWVVVHHKRRVFMQYRDSNEMLEKQTRMATLGQMAGGVAHEINNPLAIISGGIHKLKRLDERENRLSEERTKMYELMDQTTLRISKIIQGLRNFARDGSNDPMEDANLSTIIQDSLTIVEQKAKKNGVRVLTDSFADMTLRCRPIEVSRVIVNLMSNAFDAVEGCSSKWVRVRVSDMGNFVNVDVIDSGPGVPESHQDKILQPFFTTKKAGQGTGLGLSLSQKVMEDHGGKLTYVKDNPFCTFRLSLPKIGKSMPGQISEVA